VVASVSIVVGAAPDMAEVGRMAGEAIESWLRAYDGFRGLIVLTDEDGERARIITLWESPAAEEASRAARSAMRDKLVATAGMEVVGMELYDVPVLDVLSDRAA
jgi:heme-degrading monooxygenase HmoA